MKKFAINTTSNLLSIAAILGALCLAQPAKADTTDFVKGLFGVLILNEILNNNHTNTHTTHIIDRQHYNDHARVQYNRAETIRRRSIQTVCHSEYRTASNGTLVRYDYNCQGNVLRVSR
jgi:hypothetical protein